MADQVSIAPIVEGHGETTAVPSLLRRIAFEICPEAVPHIIAPQRIPKSRLLKDGELERYVELAARKSGDDGRILVMIDADDDCPAKLGPKLLARASGPTG